MKRHLEIANLILLCLAVIFSGCEETNEPGAAFGAAPSPLSPTGGTFVETQQTQFRWVGADAASGYDLEVSTDSLFDTSLVSTFTASTEVTLDSLPRVGRLYWRVRSVYSAWRTKSAWSGRELFSRFRTFVAPMPSIALCATADSGCVIAGAYSVTRIDKRGHPVWQTTIDGVARCIRPVPSGGYALVGLSSWGRAWRLDDAGQLVWSKSFGWCTSLDGIAPTADGGFVAAANEAYYHVARGDVLRLNGAGDTVWTRLSVDQVQGGFNDVAIDEGGNIWTAGIANGGALFEMRDSLGNLIWQYSRADCGPRYPQHRGKLICLLGDGSAMVAMTSECSPAVMIHLSSTGTAIWEAANGATSLVRSADGSITVLTALPSVVNQTVSGTVRWSTLIPTYTDLVAIAPCADGGYYIAGSVLIKTDPQGAFVDLPPISKVARLR